MLKNNLFSLVVLIFSCLVLFLIADVVSELLASLIVFFEKGLFPFSWNNAFSSFFTTGYVGGIILGIGLWLKGLLQKKFL